jgi:hypothetical protein
MWSFFTRAQRNTAPSIKHPAWTLLMEFDALDGQKQDDAARQLTILWSSFVEEFGGPRPYMDRPASEQQAYLDRLDRITEKTDRLKRTELGRYYFSVAILRHFLEALQSNDTSTAAIALSKRLVRLTERGRELQPARNPRSVVAAA